MPREQSPMKGTGKQIFQVPGMNELRACWEQGPERGAMGFLREMKELRIHKGR